MPYDPSPDEIKRICEQEIQPTWDEKQKISRLAMKPDHCRIQVVPLSSLPDQLVALIESIDKESDK